MAKLLDHADDAQRFEREAAALRNAINQHLRNPRNGLYWRNVDLRGRAYSQVTVDEVFPVLFQVAEPDTVRAISARVAAADFMTPAGIRVLPDQDPRYDPSFESGVLGGVWSGATWWFAMSCQQTDPGLTADALRRTYRQFVDDPRAANTVPGQFSEWLDGATLVNRGMRLSPWDAPRFLWVALEGLAGLKLESDTIRLAPRLPPDWLWLGLRDLPYRGRRLSCFLARQQGELHVYTADAFAGELPQHRYDAVLRGAEPTTVNVTAMAFGHAEERVICLGNSQSSSMQAPVLAHRVLNTGRTYQVARLSSMEPDWHDMGTASGKDVRWISTRLGPGGYALFRFRPQA